MDPIPFWSHPDVAKAVIALCVSLAGLFAAARAAVWGWAVYQRRRAEHPLVTPRQLRRASDRKLLALERGLAAVTAEVAALKGDVQRVNGKVTGLEGDASFLRIKVDQAGVQLAELKEAKRLAREETHALRVELTAMSARTEESLDWIKAALLRLENRRG